MVPFKGVRRTSDVGAHANSNSNSAQANAVDSQAGGSEGGLILAKQVPSPTIGEIPTSPIVGEGVYV